MAENKDIIKLSSFKKTIIVVDEIQENGNYQPEICQNAYDPNKVSMYVDQQKNETLMSNYYTIEEIEEILSGKTNIDSVYTKDETYNKDEVYNVSQIDFLLKLKVNKVDVYSKIDMNTLLDLKANKNEIYDKNEIDEILGSYYTKIEIDTILENKADKATTLSEYGITDAYTKTEVDDLINLKYFEIDNTILSQELLPNVAYKFTTRTNDLVLTLSPITDTTILNVYYFIINTGDTLPSITWPNDLIWYEDTAPTITINKHYEFSIIDNVVKYYEV